MRLNSGRELMWNADIQFYPHLDQFSAMFLEKYVPQTLRDRKKDEFMALEKGGMFVAAIRTSSMPFLYIVCNW